MGRLGSATTNNRLNKRKFMKNKANNLSLSVAVLTVSLVCPVSNEAWAQVGISQLRAPDGSPDPALSVDNNGNVAIGTTSPTTKLDVRGHLTLDNGNDPLIITGTSSQEQNRYLKLLNSLSFASASGLKAGGILVSANYAFANPGKNDLIVQGRVGIGTPNPRHTLGIASGPSWTSAQWGGAVELARANAIAWHPNGGGMSFGLGSTEGGFYLFRTADAPGLFTKPPLYDFILSNAGNVGIGTTIPQSKLDVNGQIRSTTLLLTSDRHAKMNFQDVDTRAVLQKVSRLPLSTWQYTNAPGVRHLGPMAQDFKASFPDLGEDDKHIATVDADGVALASIQALHQLVQEKDSEIAALKRELSVLKNELAGVKDTVSDRLAALEKAMVKDLPQASVGLVAAH